VAAILFKPAFALARLLEARKIGARELLDLSWAQVEKHIGALNAVILLDVEEARKSAAVHRLPETGAETKADGRIQTVCPPALAVGHF
jgi:hypothetical protein